MAAQIAKASSNLLFGQELVASIPGKESGSALAQKIRDINILGKVKKAGEIQASEGGVYMVNYLDPSTPRGLKGSNVKHVSELNVIPEFGPDADELIAATVISEWDKSKKGKNSPVFRLFQRHTPGRVASELFKGSTTKKGAQIELTEFDVTEGILPDIYTGVNDLLVTYIPGHPSAEGPYGLSDYHELDYMLLACDEVLSSMQERMRLASPIIYVDDNMVTEANDGGPLFEVPPGMRVVKARNDESDKPLFEISWPKPGLNGFTEYHDTLFRLTLIGAGIAPQSLGMSVEGGAESGVARRLSMAHTLTELKGKARTWENKLAKVLTIALELDKAMGIWNYEDTVVSVEVFEGFEDDPVETQENVAAAYSSGLMSIHTALKKMHKSWTEEQITAEIESIDADLNRAASAPTVQTPTDNPGSTSTTPAQSLTALIDSL